jgi:hypothetical protein
VPLSVLAVPLRVLAVPLIFLLTVKHHLVPNLRMTSVSLLRHLHFSCPLS